MSRTSTFNGNTFCFRLGHLKSGMFCEVESHEKITRCRLQSGNSEMEIGEQGEAAKLEDSGGREMMLWKRRLEGKARLLEWRRLV